MRFFDEPIETMQREDLERLQLAKLQGMLARISGRNRFQDAKMKAAGVTPQDIRSLADLAAFPLSTKDELIQAQADHPTLSTNATYPESAYFRFHQTSGTTGMPLRVFDTQESWDWWGRCWGYVLTGAGLTADDRIFMSFSFGPFIGFWAAVEGAREVGAMMVSGGGRDSLQRLHLMREMKVTALCSTPTYALRMAEVARESGFDLDDIPVRVTIHAGEPGANVPATKARIEGAWSAKCFDHAGASEVGAHSFECDVQPGGMHAIESEFIIEVLDPETEKSVPMGEIGELIVTNLGRVGYPVIRYRSGDLVRLNSEPCQCGRTFARFDGGVLGRVDDMVIVKGVNVFPSAIENLVRQFEAVDEYQVSVFQRHQMGELVIALEVGESSQAEATRAAVERAVQNALGLRPTVEVVARGSLPRFEMKANRFSVKE